MADPTVRLNPIDHPAGTVFLVRENTYGKKDRDELKQMRVMRWSESGTAWYDGSRWSSDLPLVFDIVKPDDVGVGSGVKVPSANDIEVYLDWVDGMVACHSNIPIPSEFKNSVENFLRNLHNEVD